MIHERKQKKVYQLLQCTMIVCSVVLFVVLFVLSPIACCVRCVSVCSFHVTLRARGRRNAIEQMRLSYVANLLGYDVYVVGTKQRLDGAFVRSDARFQHARRYNIYVYIIFSNEQKNPI